MPCAIWRTAGECNSLIDRQAKLAAGLFEHKPNYCIRPSQRLETSEAETKTLVFDVNCTKAKIASQAWQRM
jgi:hypothetical protein